MVAKVLVAIAVGFAVSIPLTFWLLKKVRVKSKVRHFQVSLAIGLPTALFVFLLQTSFAVPVVVITVTVSLLFVALELTLRRLVAESPDRKVTFEAGKNGTLVPFEDARAAAGTYPYDYMTKEFWSEMKEFTRSRSSQKDDYKKSQDSPKKMSRNSYKMHSTISFKGENYSMLSGVRTTTDSSRVSSTRSISIIGGSTVFCEEVPDDLTIASFIQRFFNAESLSIRVINCGASGATVIDRVEMLRDANAVHKEDVVVIYFGDNDSGWLDHKSQKYAQEIIWLPTRVLRALAEIGLETARWMYGELSPLSFRKFSSAAVNHTVDSLISAHEYCQSKGAHMVAILQPNLYTLRTKSQFEIQLEKRFAIDVRSLVLDAYRRYEEWVKETPYAVSATHIFDKAPAPVFLDWAHVNARGNEIIASFIFEELQRREMLSSDSKL
jgi:lysophospholipase L1-like esterase